MSALPMPAETAPSGLPCCGHLHWGAHFCHLYETRDDLVETLVPFFAEGLAHGEQCLWVTSEPLTADDARAELAKRVPDLPRRLKIGQIRIVDYDDWYTGTGEFDEQATLDAWVDAEQSALAAGWSGLRLTGNVTFLKSAQQWRQFEHYESRVSDTFAGRRLIGLCSYQTQATSAAEVLDVVRNHQFTLARRDGQWEVLEAGALSAARRDLAAANRMLESRVVARTSELREALALVESQKRELERALRERDDSQRQLQQELDDAQKLQQLSATLIDEGVDDRLFDRLVEAASSFLESDFATIQRLDRKRGDLELIASRGLREEDVELWRWVRRDENTSCGLALRGRSRSVVEDYSQDPRIDPPTRAAFASAGIAAAQSTPLLSRAGEFLGMISTHWARPQRPSERGLRLLDVVARQAADLLERAGTMEALRERARELVEADRRKDEFLATLAHELRNPLAPLRNGLGLLRGGRPGVQERVLPMMDRQLGHMVRLIDDLLDVSRVSRGAITLDRQRVTLQSVVQMAVETSRPVIDAAHHDFSITLPGQPVWLEADATRMAQVISNVLTNAAKYTPDGGRISLCAVCHSSQVELSVVDNGLGIPRDMLEAVFDLFTQVSTSLDRSRGGLGLGLSLARHLVRMHGGRIEARSDGLGTGTTFVIGLPMADPPPLDSDVVGVHESADPGLRVLVVDDNVDAAESLGMLLEMEGHEVCVLDDSLQAVDRAVAFQPDTILLDLGMPGLDGYQLAGLLRAEPRLKHVRLVAVSGWGTAADRQRTRAAGFDAHLTKPATLEDLRGAVRE